MMTMIDDDIDDGYIDIKEREWIFLISESHE